MLQSRFGDKSLKFKVVCPQNGTAVFERVKQSSTYFRDKVLNPHRSPFGTALFAILETAQDCKTVYDRILVSGRIYWGRYSRMTYSIYVTVHSSAVERFLLLKTLSYTWIKCVYRENTESAFSFLFFSLKTLFRTWIQRSSSQKNKTWGGELFFPLKFLFHSTFK